MLRVTHSLLALALASALGCGAGPFGGGDDTSNPNGDGGPDTQYREVDTSVFLTTGSLRAVEGGILNGLSGLVLDRVTLTDPTIREGGILNGLDSNDLIEGTNKTVAEATREVLSYVYGCALPSGSSVVLEIAGEEWIFKGEVGLAPEWETEACGAECQEWVSACVLARTNAFDLPVYISLRGDHPALQPSAQELATYTLREGSYYGNIFEGAILDHAYACAGGPGGAMWELTDRFCAVIGDNCPINTVSDCNIQEFACGTISGCDSETACSNWDADGNPTTCYSEKIQCTQSPSPAGTAYSRVLTVYIQPPEPVCGDTICQEGESLTCAADCVNHWAKSYGSGCNERSEGLARDSAGNIAFAGEFTGEIELGGVTYTSTSNQDEDIFVAKLDSSGAFMWGRTIQIGALSKVGSVATNDAGDVFLAGYFSEPADFGGGTETPSGLSYFVAQYDGATGSFVRSQVYSSGVSFIALLPPPGVEVAVVGSDVYLAFAFQGTIDLGIAGKQPAATRWDILVLRLDSQLQFTDHAQISGGGDELLSAMAVDPSGAIALGGEFTQQLKAGNQLSTNDVGEFIARIDSTLTPDWAIALSSSGATRALVGDVTIGANGLIGITGKFRGTMSLGATQLSSTGNTDDAFVAAIDSAGVASWAKSYGHPTHVSDGLAIDWAEDGSFVTAFRMNAPNGEQIDIEGTTFAPGEFADAVLVRYRPEDGAAVSVTHTGSSVSEDVHQLIATSGGEVVVTGEFSGTLKFTGTYLTNEGGSSPTLQPADVFVTRISNLP